MINYVKKQAIRKYFVSGKLVVALIETYGTLRQFIAQLIILNIIRYVRDWLKRLKNGYGHLHMPGIQI